MSPRPPRTPKPPTAESGGSVRGDADARPAPQGEALWRQRPVPPPRPAAAPPRVPGGGGGAGGSPASTDADLGAPALALPLQGLCDGRGTGGPGTEEPPVPRVPSCRSPTPGLRPAQHGHLGPPTGRVAPGRWGPPVWQVDTLQVGWRRSWSRKNCRAPCQEHARPAGAHLLLGDLVRERAGPVRLLARAPDEPVQTRRRAVRPGGPCRPRASPHPNRPRAGHLVHTATFSGSWM